VYVCEEGKGKQTRERQSASKQMRGNKEAELVPEAVLRAKAKNTTTDEEYLGRVDKKPKKRTSGL